MSARSACWPSWRRGSGGCRMPRHLLRRALEIAPGLGPPRGPIWRWCSAAWAGRRRRWSCSTTCSRRSRTIGPLNLKAATLGRLGDFDEAIQLYEHVLEQRPEPAARLAELWPHAEDGRAAGRRHRRLSQGDRAEARRWARRGGAWPTSRPLRFDEADIAAMQSGAGEPGLKDEDRFHLDFALGKAMHDAGTDRRGIRALCRGQCAAPEASSVRGEEITELVDRSIEAFTAETLADGRAAARRQTRSSSSECRAPDRRWSSRSCRRTAWSKERPNCRTSRRSRARAASYSEHAREIDRGRSGASAARNISSARRSSGGPSGPISSTNCPTTGCSCRSSIGPAQRQDHRRAAASARLLLLELPPAFRARPGLHLRSRPTSAIIMPTMCG